MNKQELIKKIEALPAHNARINKGIVLDLVKQLDEPQPVKVPLFVADWIEECKKKGDLSLGGAIQLPCPEIYEWLMAWENQETFARAWLDGYDVEEEKRYLVKVKGMNEECEYLVFGELSNTWKFRGLNEFGELKKYHTRKELEEAGFGWVFSCEGIEIEEVE